MVIGTGTWSDGDDQTGAAYVFVRSGGVWIEQQRLISSDNEDGDIFGSSVAISDEFIVVGAQQEDYLGLNNAGSAYVFKRVGDTWVETQKLGASDAANYDHFGYPIAMSDSVLAVSALLDDDAAQDSGSVYLFTRTGDTWTEHQKLAASDAGQGDQFGWRVSISGDTILIPTPFHDHSALSDAGAAYLFTRSGDHWVERQKLTAPDAESEDRFGWGSDLFGDMAVIGADADDHSGLSDAGSAYVFLLVLFGDDFESGDTSGWSAVTP
jgi:hypothetical protein